MEKPFHLTETPLRGGRTTDGVVRAGNTVLRPASNNSAFVQALLRSLEQDGVFFVPRHLGTDERNRDVFSYIEGTVPSDLGTYDDATLKQAGALIRHYHDATSTFAKDLRTKALSSASGTIEVICHNDLSPCNFVFQDGRPEAIIDFDAAAPGSRLHDLGYAAWLWLDIGNDNFNASEQAVRLDAFVSGYGSIERRALVAAILYRQSLLVSDASKGDLKEMREWATSCKEWVKRHESELVC